MVREMDFVDECYADKDLSLLKKLTLVIPTYNRNYYLSRCLWYHAHFPFGQIIVADSSHEDKKVVNRKTVAKVLEMFGANILYLEYEPETEKYGGDIYRKWGDAVMHVETQYSQICTDKEFMIPTTQAQCIKFLDTNIDYATVDGKYYHLTGSIKDSKFERVYNTKCPLPYESALNRYLIAASRVDASINLMAIRRTECHKNIFNQMYSFNVDDIRFGECVQEFLTLIYAKSHHIDSIPYNCRDNTHLISKRGVTIKSESSNSRYPKINKYIEYGIYELYLNNAINCIVNYLHNFDTKNIDKYMFREIVSDTFSTAIEQRGFYGHQTTINRLILTFPKFIQKYMFYLVYRISRYINVNPNQDFIDNELQLIKTIVDIYENKNDKSII